jgi:hypothetical protein
VLKKVTVAVLACLTLFLSKRSMSDGHVHHAERRAAANASAQEAPPAKRSHTVALY